MAEKLYIGIDLGTTNSAISFGHIAGENKFEANICNVNRIGKEGGMDTKATLPSVAYYQINPKTGEKRTIIGDFAKHQYGRKHGNVVKSVKNYMGSTVPMALDEKLGNKYPEDVSAEILKHLLIGAKDKLTLAEDLKDVVITIPASFDSDQCDATLRAAEKAGLDVKNADGEYRREILLDEPKAVIYNIANMAASGQITKNTIDFSTKKNVLVFDLGGGTLDVALYSVNDEKGLDFPIIDELAIGRYTRIGGDDFDKLLSDYLVKKFLESSNLTKDEVEFDELSELMESRAEYIKFELSEKMFNSKFSGNTLSDDYKFGIHEMELYKGVGFDIYLTKKEIETVLNPIMGNHLIKEDMNRIDRLSSGKDVENIIYPILDVLAKAKDNGHSIDIDAIILNGGMTKFYLVQERIKKFFGKNPVTINDPDLAVAKGASYYQYCLEKLDVAIASNAKEHDSKAVKTGSTKKATFLKMGKTVVSDDINLGLDNGSVCKLVKAGTELPTRRITINSLKIPVGTDRIELPFFLGRGRTVNAPNRKIANRIIDLRKNYPAGTEVTLLVHVDQDKVLNIRGYIGKNRAESISVTVDTGSSMHEDSKEVVEKTPSIKKEVLNVEVQMERLRKNTELLENIRDKANGRALHPLQKKQQNEAKCNIGEVTAKIKNCLNKQSFEKEIIENLEKAENTGILKGKLINLGEFIYPEMSDEGKDRFKKICRDCLDPRAMLNGKNQLTITRAIIALGEINDSERDKEIERLIKHSSAKNYRSNLIRTLGKISADNELLARHFLGISLEDKELPYWIYAVGKSFSRTVSRSTEGAVEKIAKKLVNVFKNSNQNKELAIIAIGEICSSLEGVNYKLNDIFIEKIGDELANCIKCCEENKLKERARLVLDVVLGLKLTNEEEARWNAMIKK